MSNFSLTIFGIPSLCRSDLCLGRSLSYSLLLRTSLLLKSLLFSFLFGFLIGFLRFLGTLFNGLLGFLSIGNLLLEILLGLSLLELFGDFLLELSLHSLCLLGRGSLS